MEGHSVLDGLEVRVAFSGLWKENLTELSGGQRLVPNFVVAVDPQLSGYYYISTTIIVQILKGKYSRIWQCIKIFPFDNFQ